MDILSFGGLTIDHLYKVTRIPKVHFEGEIKNYGTYYGGRAPNVAVMAAKLGLKTGVVSPVGRDFSTSGYEKHLKSLGVNPDGIIYYPNKDTTKLVIFTDEKGDQISFFYLGASEHFKGMDVPRELIKKSNVIHISSSGDYKFNLRVAEEARSMGKIITFDPGNDPFIEIPEYLEGMISKTSFLFLNNLELEMIFEKLQIKRISDLFYHGPKLVTVMDKSTRECKIYDGNTEITTPPIKTKAVDPTGASDSFIAGFLAGYLKGYDLETCGYLGNVLTSLIVESEGCQTSLPTWELLIDRCVKHYGKSFSSRLS